MEKKIENKEKKLDNNEINKNSKIKKNIINIYSGNRNKKEIKKEIKYNLIPNPFYLDNEFFEIIIYIKSHNLSVGNYIIFDELIPNNFIRY